MVTTVYTDGGAVMHDCAATGCCVSWDGYILDAATYAEQNPGAPAVANGDPCPGRQSPDVDVWVIVGSGALPIGPGGG